MNRQQALLLLELDENAPLELAEEAYRNQCAQLDELLASVSLQPRARHQLDQSLAQLGVAISRLRQDQDGSGRYGDRPTDAEPTLKNGQAQRVAGDRPADAEPTLKNGEAQPVVGDPLATQVAWDGDGGGNFHPTTEIPASLPAASSAPRRRRHSAVLVAGASAGLLLVAMAVFLLAPDDDAEAPLPAGDAPAVAGESRAGELPSDAGRELADARRDWKLWGEKLGAEQEQLAATLDQARSEARRAQAAIDSRNREVAERHPARERLQFIEQYIVDDQFLLLLTRSLAAPLPTGLEQVNLASRERKYLFDSATSRRTALIQLDEALVARQSVRAQLARLVAEGLPAWPPEPDSVARWFPGAQTAEAERLVALTASAARAFETGKFTTATKRYRLAAAGLAGLELVPGGGHNEIEEQIAQLFALGKEAISSNRLSRPADSSALYYALEIETLEPDRAEAAELMAGIQRRYIALAHSQLGRGEANKAVRYASMAVAMGADEADVEAIYKAAAAEGEKQFQPLRPVEEVEGIAMLTLPPGRFTMGARSSALRDFADNVGSFFGSIFGGEESVDYSGGDSEVPPHRVAIESRVALSRFEITVAQFREFVASTDYLTDAELHGYSYAWLDDREQRVEGKNWRHDYLGHRAPGDLPVVHVSYRDAVAFSRWLSAKTGANYRLPSESEFEYAARAGADSLLPWSGRTPPSDAGNFRGEDDVPPPGWRSGQVRSVPDYGDGAFGPAPVGRYALNGYGLGDMLGNVAEWTADCFHRDYRGKGKSQMARTDGDCNRGMVRGTDWATDVRLLRLSYRHARPVSYSSNTLGFRVARDIKIEGQGGS